METKPEDIARAKTIGVDVLRASGSSCYMVSNARDSEIEERHGESVTNNRAPHPSVQVFWMKCHYR